MWTRYRNSASRRLIVCITILAMLANVLRPIPAAAQAENIPTLTETLVTLGLTFDDALPLLVEGLGQAAPRAGADTVAQRAGYRKAIRRALQSYGRFAQSVAARLHYLVKEKLITPQNARAAIRNRGTWRAAARAGSVALEPLLGLLLVVEVGAIGFLGGREVRQMILRKIDKTASDAEAAAYANLLKSLIERTTSPTGNLALCSGMGLDEAATRLLINMRTARTPYWSILCPRAPRRPTKKLSGRDRCTCEDWDKDGRYGVVLNGTTVLMPNYGTYDQCVDFKLTLGKCGASRGRFGCTCEDWNRDGRYGVVLNGRTILRANYGNYNQCVSYARTLPGCYQ